MTVKELLKTEIDQLDDNYLELLYKIVCQFPRLAAKKQDDALALLQEIADSGGLGIADPQEWQREVRRERPLPGREAA